MLIFRSGTILTLGLGVTESHCLSSKRARWQRPLLVLTNSLFIKCYDASTHMQSVRNERSLPPEERTAVFLKEPVFGEKRFVGLSYEFFCRV